MFNVVLVEPEIPANTGNIGRTCVLTGARLHLVEPLGFSLDDRMLHRAGLGYWPNLDVTVYPSWNEFLVRNGLLGSDGLRRVHLLTKKARRTYVETAYHDGDFLVFGKESFGLPEDLLAAHPNLCERIPMLSDAQSLANRDAWQAHEQALASSSSESPAGESPLLHQDICGNFVDVNDWRISALNLSNAVAIVLYEALRQTDFWGQAPALG